MINILAVTHAGIRRDMNQDTLGWSVPAGEPQRPAWAFVCDGMGGHAAGNIAAETARDTLTAAFENGLRPGMSDRSVQLLLETAVENANAAVYEKAAADPALKGMGTTVVAAVVQGNTLYLCHAGDSRAYLLRGGTATRLTKDHSVVQKLVDQGEITPKQALSHPERHFITKALGVSARRAAPDLDQRELLPGDMVLLCSDGLHGLVPEAELYDLCSRAVADGTADGLAERANQLGGTDNITAVVLYGIG